MTDSNAVLARPKARMQVTTMSLPRLEHQYKYTYYFLSRILAGTDK